MTRQLNLDDIQGNIVRAYSRYRYPVARYFFVNFQNPEAARGFVRAVRPYVTTAAPWTDGNPRPPVTLNIGFSFLGLYALGLPTRFLQRLPSAFIDGMKARAFMLGDRDPSVLGPNDVWDDKWDRIWQANRNGDDFNADNVHAWMSMNAAVEEGTDTPVAALEERTRWLEGLIDDSDGGVILLGGHGPDGDKSYQQASALFTTLPDGRKVATPKEHFGYTDGIGNPVFEGQYPPEEMKRRVIGRGKWMDKDKGWEPLATGEFLLGHPDESQELPPAAPPPEFMQNGTFMVYRKLHQNVEARERCVESDAERYAKVYNCDIDEARATVGAKMVGRWKDGVPLAKAPTYADWQALAEHKGFNDPARAAAAYRAYLTGDEATDFGYADDMNGAKCPLGAHLRRANTRDYLDPHNKPSGRNEDATTRLNKRRRILRRGLPYGPNELDVIPDDGEQGIIFMVICADIFRQFEFVQQQWIEYGLDFNTGNTTCPLVGRSYDGKIHVIQSEPGSGKPPYIMDKLETFVETRGGEYFFLPSMTALTLMEMGVVDPT